MSLSYFSGFSLMKTLVLRRESHMKTTTRRLGLEMLEDRSLLSVSVGTVAIDPVVAPVDALVAPAATLTPSVTNAATAFVAPTAALASSFTYAATALDGTPVSVNKAGQVALNQNGNVVLWENGVYTTVGTGTAIKINNNGQVLSWNAAAGTMSIYAKGGGTISYTVPSGYIPVDMNDKLEIVGNTARSPRSDYYTAWYFKNGQYTPIVVDPNTSSNRTAAYSINNNSQVTGTADFFVSGFDVFVWKPTANGGVISDRGNNNFAFDQAEGRAINDNGLIAAAGLSWSDFIWQGGQVSGTTWTSLGSLDPTYDTIPTGINNFGDIVGEGVSPFIYTGGAIYDLATIAPTGILFSYSSVAINDAGWIVTSGSVDGVGTGVLLKPTAGTLVNGELRLQGTAGNDQITLSVAKTNLVVKVNSQTLRFPVADVKSIVISAGDGNDTIRLNAGVISTTVYGGGGNDTFIINNGGGNTLVGGAGDDTYKFGANSILPDVIVENQNEGSDTLDFSALPAASPVTVNLLSNAALAMTGTTFLATGSAANMENVRGTSGDDVITLNSALNTVRAGAGNDTIYGALDYSKDVIDGGPGTNTLVGDFDAIDIRRNIQVYQVGPNPALPPVTGAGLRGSYWVGSKMGTIIYEVTRVFPHVGSGGWVTIDNNQYWGVMTTSGGVTGLTFYYGTDSTGPQAGSAILQLQPDGTMTGTIQLTNRKGVLTGTGTVLLRQY
jgi:hypothetical protein